MSRVCLAAPILVLLALPAAAVDIVEMKSGRLYEAEAVRLQGDKLWIRLATPPGRTVAFTVPIEKVVPEYVYYAWADRLAPDDLKGQLELAGWARGNGLFDLALKRYEIAAALGEPGRAELDAYREVRAAEEGRFLYRRARALFDEGKLKEARLAAGQVMKRFPEAPEVQLTRELLKILEEREAFLTGEKRKKEAARLAKRHRRDLRRLTGHVRRGHELVRKADFRRPDSARRRLTLGTRIFRGVGEALEEMLLLIEDAALRKRASDLFGFVQERRASWLLLLADVRYVAGDTLGSLESVHELLALDPGNKDARVLREKILTGPPADAGQGFDPAFVNRFGGRGWGGYGNPYAPIFGPFRRDTVGIGITPIRRYIFWDAFGRKRVIEIGAGHR
ncbi:MAG: hypothetical protein ACE5JG_01770 [Planctomycetota bacterium]